MFVKIRICIGKKSYFGTFEVRCQLTFQGGHTVKIRLGKNIMEMENDVKKMEIVEDFK